MAGLGGKRGVGDGEARGVAGLGKSILSAVLLLGAVACAQQDDEWRRETTDQVAAMDSSLSQISSTLAELQGTASQTNAFLDLVADGLIEQARELDDEGERVSSLERSMGGLSDNLDQRLLDFVGRTSRTDRILSSIERDIDMLSVNITALSKRMDRLRGELECELGGYGLCAGEIETLASVADQLYDIGEAINKLEKRVKAGAMGVYYLEQDLRSEIRSMKEDLGLVSVRTHSSADSAFTGEFFYKQH